MEKVTKISLAFLAIVFIAILVLFKKCGKQKTSENEIDKAIAQSIELAKKQELTALSAISPRREDAIISTMRGFSAASYRNYGNVFVRSRHIDLKS